MNEENEDYWIEPNNLHYHLWQLAIDSKYQNCGVGTMLLQRGIEQADKDAVDPTLFSTLRAQDLHQEMGYLKPLDVVYGGPGHDDNDSDDRYRRGKHSLDRFFIVYFSRAAVRKKKAHIRTRNETTFRSTTISATSHHMRSMGFKILRVCCKPRK